MRPADRSFRISSNATSDHDIASRNEIEEAQEEGRTSEEVIMCIDVRDRGTVGCCYYDSSTGSLRLVEDIRCGGLDAIDTCEYIP